MWRALRAELAYFRPWLLGGLGIGAGVTILLGILLGIFGGAEDTPSFLPGMFAVLAGMVVAFIAQSYRAEERRARLLLSGSLTPAQLSGVLVLLPPCLVGLGALAAVPMLALSAALSAGYDSSTQGVLAILTGQFLAYAQLGPLFQETAAARRQGRSRPAMVGSLAIAVVLPVLISFYWFSHRPLVFVAGYVVMVGIIAIVSAKLYQGRTDFTR
jgi:hypothetical protein